jgi:hypothetical protein
MVSTVQGGKCEDNGDSEGFCCSGGGDEMSEGGGGAVSLPAVAAITLHLRQRRQRHQLLL